MLFESSLPSPTVVVRDVGFSDHRPLRWVSPFQRPPPVYTTAHRRLWRSFCLDTFIADLQTSALCDERQYEHLQNGDALAKLYHDTVAGLLYKQIPVRQVKSRVVECRRAKRVLMSMERAAHRTGPLSDNNLPAVAAWRVQRRQYFTLLQQKRSDYLDETSGR